MVVLYAVSSSLSLHVVHGSTYYGHMVLIECKIIIVMNYTHNSIIKLTIILRFTLHEVVLDLRTLSIDFDIIPHSIGVIQTKGDCILCKHCMAGHSQCCHRSTGILIIA